MSVRAIRGDCLDVLPTLGPVDAIVTDPPYGLGFMGVAWDTMPANRGKPVVVRQPDCKWDGDIAFRPETWATIGTALKPGGYLLAFGGTRTWHRLAALPTMAMTDACPF